MNRPDESPKNSIIIYTTEDGLTKIDATFDGDTVWLSIDQMAELFQRDRSVIGKHVRNIFKEGELQKESVWAKFAYTAADGKVYDVDYYNLDVIISVGYRVKSPEGVRFRQWATRLIKEHLTRGYTLNQQRLQSNAHELQAALELVRKAAQSPDLQLETGRGLIDIVTRYAHAFVLLQQYDEGLLTEPKTEVGGTLPTVQQARQMLADLKRDLTRKGDATDLFARERGDGLAALLGNLAQSVFGEPAYPSIEAKAAHLLYFVIKNHPFADGNKRSGAYLFVDFLHRNGRLMDATDVPVINDVGLAALALLIAESAPEQKDTMIKLVMNMLAIRQ